MGKKPIENQEPETKTPETATNSDWMAFFREGKTIRSVSYGKWEPSKDQTKEALHVLARKAGTKEWLRFEDGAFKPAPEMQIQADFEWKKHQRGVIRRVLGHVGDRLAQMKLRKTADISKIVGEGGKVDWNRLFELNLSQKYSMRKTRRVEVFPDGTEGLGEKQVLDKLKREGLYFSGQNPQEFPEVIDEEIRPLCQEINRAEWAKSYDGCASHERDRVRQPYLGIWLDIESPQAKALVEKMQAFKGEWGATHPKTEIILDLTPRFFVKNRAKVLGLHVALGIRAKSQDEKAHYSKTDEFGREIKEFFGAIEKKFRDAERAV